MNHLQKFTYDSSEIRTIIENDEIWFAGIDICNILGYSDSYATVMKLDDDERKLDRLRDGQGKQKETLTVNESGLYSLILSSTKPEAKAFKRWVTHEVLPEIRKTGKYTSDEISKQSAYLKDIQKATKALKDKLTEKNSEIRELKSQIKAQEQKFWDTFDTDPRQLKLPFEE